MLVKFKIINIISNIHPSPFPSQAYYLAATAIARTDSSPSFPAAPPHLEPPTLSAP